MTSGTRSSSLAKDQHDSCERQHDTGDLHAERSTVRLLTEQQSFVEGAHYAPHDHCEPRDHTRDASEGPTLETNEAEPQERVLGTLNEGDRDSRANLTVVVHSEPLMREVATTIDHELGTEDPAECPAGNESWHQGIGEACERTPGPPAALEEQADAERERNPAETRESALPHGDPARRVTGVVAPIGRDVGGPSAHETGHNEGEGELRERSDVDVGPRESPSRVEITDVGGDRESETVDMKDEWTEVKRSGNAGHG